MALTKVASQMLVGNSSSDATVTGLGVQALNSNSGSNNTAVGNQSLYSNTTASNNTAVGYQSGYNNTTGGYNTAIGQQALYSNTTAYDNTAVGYQALYNSNRTADTAGWNTGIGFQAGYGLTTGQANTFVGHGCGSAITTGSNNTIIGVYNGNSGGLDIRTSSNYIVLSDGAGNPRVTVDNNGKVYLGATAAGTGSVSSTGWVKLPNGLIMQWGSCVSNTKTNFAITFPNAIFSATGTAWYSAATTTATQADWNNTDTTGIRYIVSQANSALAGQTIYYVAIGY